MPRYDHKRIETKWQQYWEEQGTFVTPDDPSKRKLYVLDMFPYPSGDGLHVGHPEGYTATDIVCRYSRMRGKNVLHPMGWDAFGLPAEQHAIKTGTHPRVTTEKNIATFRRQLKSLGFSYDWNRELSTTDPDYFRWTQWIFLQIFETWYDPTIQWTGPDGKQRIGRGRPIAELPIPDEVRKQGDEAVRRYQDRHRLAYQHEAPVNWCPALGTVLANEEIIDGKSERGGHPVERLPLRQWMLGITAYADRLIDDLDEVEWPESIKLLQRNWIGRSEGAEVDFYVGEVGGDAETRGRGDAGMEDEGGSGRGPAASSAERGEGETKARRLTSASSVESRPAGPGTSDAGTRGRGDAGTEDEGGSGRGGEGGTKARRLRPAGPGTSDAKTRGRGDAGNGFEEWKTAREKSGFPAEPSDDVLRVYTTRPDTLYGATYMVLAPEHPFVARITTPEQRAAVDAYRKQAAAKSDLDRTDLAKEKTGVFTGAYAINPVNAERIPIWIADYVLISYGTGAIMAVPAHDERDFEFAKEYHLPIRTVVEPPAEWLVANTIFFKGPSAEGMQAEVERLDQLIEQYKKEGARPGPINGLIKSRQMVIDYFAQDTAQKVEMIAQLPRIHREHPLAFEQSFAGEGAAVNSGPYDGLQTAEFKQCITADLSAKGLGRKAVNFRLRDWLFSRQHFWGEPFPVWHELDAQGKMTGLMRADPVESLPVNLPENFDFKPHGRPDPPLAEAPADWLYKTTADGTKLMRETNSMPQWAGSCWYYIRFADPKNSKRFVDSEKEKYWLPVDLYIGGAEHAVLHLLYARFWHKVLFDRGHLTTSEPFHRLVNQGMILGEAEFTGYKSLKGDWGSAGFIADRETYPGKTVKLDAALVEKKGDEFVLKENPAIVVESRAFKMSKSRGNVINPDVVVARYGADALRMYEMFMGPLEQVKPWSMSGVEGVSRFLGRVWRMIADERADAVQLNAAVRDVAPDESQLRVLHKTIKAVTDDIEKLSFNTAISRMMEFTNEISPLEARPKSILKPFVLLLSPFAPHIAEELWALFGNTKTLAYEPWPKYDESKLAEAEIEIPVQVNGKLRARIKVPADADQAAIQKAAERDANVAEQLAGKTVAKVIVVPGRLVNFVVKS